MMLKSKQVEIGLAIKNQTITLPLSVSNFTNYRRKRRQCKTVHFDWS